MFQHRPSMAATAITALSPLLLLLLPLLLLSWRRILAGHLGQYLLLLLQQICALHIARQYSLHHRAVLASNLLLHMQDLALGWDTADLMRSHGSQQRGLACPIAPNQAVPPAKCKHQVALLDEVLAPIADVKLVQTQIARSHTTCTPRLRVAQDHGGSATHSILGTGLVRLKGSSRCGFLFGLQLLHALLVLFADLGQGGSCLLLRSSLSGGG
mmetsp:Transcript_9202/g.23297  ORF Transcript_9202/g.23297 Transcript_9202/m.23297 type:complete len:213 (-) Transcript_9202:374-1012(-)